MADIVDRKTRSRMMSGIKGKNTKPEIKIRKALFSKGYRYRLHKKKLPGKPDLVFPKYKAVVFIHGCFWHGHGCSLFRWPSSNVKFWENKITQNQHKDALNIEELEQKGWKVLTIWECAIRGKHKINFEHVIETASVWLEKHRGNMEIFENSKQ